MKHADRLKARAYARLGANAGSPRAADLEKLPVTAQTIYLYVLLYKADHDGISPSVQEIKKGCRLASTSNIANHLAMLERAGLITRLPGTSRGIMVIGGEWRMQPEAERAAKWRDMLGNTAGDVSVVYALAPDEESSL